jgi:hypothetical protein
MVITMFGVMSSALVCPCVVELRATLKKSWSEAPGSGRNGRRNRWTDLTEITSCFKNRVRQKQSI